MKLIKILNTWSTFLSDISNLVSIISILMTIALYALGKLIYTYRLKKFSVTMRPRLLSEEEFYNACNQYIKTRLKSETGKRYVFKQFEKKEPLENNEIIITTLKKIPEKKYIIPIKDGAVAINRGGIHVVKLFQASGNLKYDKNWYFNNLKIDNPFDYKGDYYYLIRNVGTNYEVYNINVVTLSELLFKVQNSLIVPKYTYE